MKEKEKEKVEKEKEQVEKEKLKEKAEKEKEKHRDEEEDESCDAITSAVTNGKSSSNDEYCLPPPPIQTTARGGGGGAANKRPKGRLKKKPKRVIKINGLDLLHTQTLLSTSPQGGGHTYFLENFFSRLLLYNNITFVWN